VAGRAVLKMGKKGVYNVGESMVASGQIIPIIGAGSNGFSSFDPIITNYNNETDKPRTFAVKDLIMAEIARIKLTDYVQFEKLSHVELGALDWVEFLTEINGKFDQTLDEIEYKGFKIQHTKEKWRAITPRYFLFSPNLSGEIPITFTGGLAALSGLTPLPSYLYMGGAIL
jgi:hypothetical protein